MMLWKILYSPYDAGALVITIIGLGVQVIKDLAQRRRGP
jgi:hypothetical protein